MSQFNSEPIEAKVSQAKVRFDKSETAVVNSEPIEAKVSQAKVRQPRFRKGL